ncbi:hypothetical protein P9E80_01215 [Bacillus velezensis]|uniref:hypothetical protein n=1 Tax=Bacillus TaxID=1386 RepID=UPI00146F8437|nr:hypothetical protein [Bacillus velezensis]MEC1826705.1 hypothetical protein [Bacillus velezensis]NMW08049.1 hypothetical protein [Bacillus velezensis]
MKLQAERNFSLSAGIPAYRSVLITDEDRRREQLRKELYKELRINPMKSARR